MRISEKLLQIAEDRVTMIRRSLDACHPSDTRRREKLQHDLWDAEAQVADKRQMVAHDRA